MKALKEKRSMRVSVQERIAWGAYLSLMENPWIRICLRNLRKEG